MSDEREREISRPSLADAIDLLDLVRSTEDGARISTESPAPLTEPQPEPRISAPPASAPRTIPPAAAEEFVDVGSDAIDLPPSVPPSKLPRDSRPNPPVKAITLPKPKPVPVTPEPSTAMPPAVGIVLVLGLAIGGLYAILALPSDPKPAPRARELGAEPPNLQLERRPE